MIQDQSQTSYNSYAELMGALEGLHQQRSTGTLFIATPDNHFGRIVLREGEIVSLVFGTKSGEAAIPFIRAVKSGKFRFSQGQTPTDASESLPPSPVLLRRLSTSLAPPPVPKVPPAIDLSRLGQIYKVIEEELVEFVGPIASLICSEHKAKFGAIAKTSSLYSLLESVANEIGDPDKARQFKERVWARIGP
jgi:hypothetical protein